MVIDEELEGVLFFNSTRTYTLAILDSLNNIKHWVKKADGKYNEEVIPITFGSYEKSLRLEDIKQDVILAGNYNFVPRMVLSFEGLTKTPDRDTNKFQKISKRVTGPDGDVNLNFGYNCVAYDFQFNLMIQARGLNEAFMITEQILPMFRPSYTVSVKEFPLFDEKTETQLQIEDPSFDIIEEYEDTDVNIVNVTAALTIRGNLYMPLSIVAPVKTFKMFNHLWDTQELQDSQRASIYEYDVCEYDGNIIRNTVEEHFAPKKHWDEPETDNKEVASCDAPEVEEAEVPCKVPYNVPCEPKEK